MPLFFFKTIRQTWRFLRILGGFALLALGIVLFVAPGPGWLVSLMGLGLLAAEFAWARRLLDRLKHQGARIRDILLSRRSARTV